MRSRLATQSDDEAAGDVAAPRLSLEDHATSVEVPLPASGPGKPLALSEERAPSSELPSDSSHDEQDGLDEGFRLPSAIKKLSTSAQQVPPAALSKLTQDEDAAVTSDAASSTSSDNEEGPARGACLQCRMDRRPDHCNQFRVSCFLPFPPC
jgi:hypothetical protein